MVPKGTEDGLCLRLLIQIKSESLGYWYLLEFLGWILVGVRIPCVPDPCLPLLQNLMSEFSRVQLMDCV